MSLIILRECKLGILHGDYNLWLDTISEVTINNVTERTLIPRKNLFHRNNTQNVIHKNNDTSSGTFTCYLTNAFEESILFRLLGCDVYENGFVVPDSIVDTDTLPARFVIASPYNMYEIHDVKVTSVTFPLGKGFAGEIQVSFEGGALEQTTRGYTNHVFNKQGKHFELHPLEFYVDDVQYQLKSANINIAQALTWLNSRSIYDDFNKRRPVCTGHTVNITTVQYHKQEDLLPGIYNIKIKQGSVILTMEHASITKRISLEDEMVVLNSDIQPTGHMPIIQII